MLVCIHPLRIFQIARLFLDDLKFVQNISVSHMLECVCEIVQHRHATLAEDFQAPPTPWLTAIVHCNFTNVLYGKYGMLCSSILCTVWFRILHALSHILHSRFLQVSNFTKILPHFASCSIIYKLQIHWTWVLRGVFFKSWSKKLRIKYKDDYFWLYWCWRKIEYWTCEYIAQALN